MSLKGKNNAWIKPSGQFIVIGYMQHNEWASDYFREKWGGDWFDKLHETYGSFSYPYQALHKLGWIRLLTWTDGNTKALGDCFDPRVTDNTVDPSCTKRQKETLIEWCKDNEYNYHNLFTE